MDENGRETDGEYGGGYERSAKGRRYQGRVKIDFADLRMRSVRESYGIERKEDMKPGIYTRWGRARTSRVRTIARSIFQCAGTMCTLM